MIGGSHTIIKKNKIKKEYKYIYNKVNNYKI
jgi:hypothetical protein